MSADTYTHPSEELFDDLLKGMKDTLDDSIADELTRIEPDFPAILDELRRRGDDSFIGADTQSELSPAWGSAPQSSCTHARSPMTDGYGYASEDPLFGLLSDARQEIEADLAARRLLPVPPLVSASSNDAGAASSAAPKSVRWLGAALTIAAAVALLWGLGPSLARPLLGGSPTGSQAQWSERDNLERDRASARTPEPEKSNRTARRRAEAPSSELHPDPDDEHLADETVDDAAMASGIAPHDPSVLNADDADASSAGDAPSSVDMSEKTPDETSRERRPPRDLDALEAEAEALWRAGDRAGAEALLRKIIRLSRARRRADLAYGDLFTITRQLYGREREAAVWREYLESFPKGRYADDARAGLCRRESTSLAPGCWSRYTLDFPSGTHRDEARRATDAD